MDLRITESGWRQAAAYFRGVARRARNLAPLRGAARQRWREAEARRFDRNVWEPRTPETLERYTWPISGEVGTAAAQGTGHFTGALEQALTTAHMPGIRDDVFLSAGELVTNFGVEAGGPFAYAEYFHEGAGAQEPRDLFAWDEEAQLDLADDAQDHLWIGLR